MADHMSVRAITSTPQYPASALTNETKSEKHAMVCLFSRGFSPVSISYVKKIAQQSGMPHRLLGDLEHIHDPSKSLSSISLVPMTGNEDKDIVHNLYLFHGSATKEGHVVNVRHGDAEEVSTSHLMRSMHWPASESLLQAGAEKKAKNIDYHLSCESAELRNEFYPHEAFWYSNISLIFSGKKLTALDHMGAALESAVRYAHYCNTPANQSRLDQFKLFLLAGMRRGDCLTMLGGELKAPLIWHAPKSQDDLLIQNMLRNVRGHTHDCQLLTQAAQTLTPSQLNLLTPANTQLRDMFFTRLTRDDVESVRQISSIDQNLINEKSVLGTPALIWSVSLMATKCTDYLLSMGADVNAVDHFGNTALIESLQNDDPILVRTLLSLGANPNAREASGFSPLMLAVSKGLLKQVKYLIAFLAKQDVWNNNQTALTIAVNQSDYDIVDALLMNGADASCGLHQDLIDRAEERDDLAIADLLKRSLVHYDSDYDSVDMEIDQPKSGNQSFMPT